MGIDAFLEEVRSRLDIVSVVSSYVPLKRVGKNYQGLCPFHIEKTPSFTVSPDKQMFYCFGCGVGGDVIKFIQLIEGVDFLEAVEMAAQLAGLSLDEIRRESPKDKREKDRLKALHALLASSFSSILRTDAGTVAREYLKSRGITPLWWEVFKIGFLPADMDIAPLCYKRGFTQEELIATGLFYRKGDGLVCRLSNRVIIPICDYAGSVVAFGGRVIGEGEPKYLNSPETPIFQKGKLLFGWHLAKEYIRTKGRVILVEGYMDVISMHIAGFRETVASLGTAFTVEQAKRISRLTRNVFILYDGDNAGLKAAFRASKVFYAVGVEPKVVVLPDGKDPDDFLKDVGPLDLEALMVRAKTPVDMLIEEDVGGALGTREKLRRIFELLEDTKDALVVDSVLSYAATRLGLPFEDVRASFKESRRAVIRKQENRDNGRRVSWERDFLVYLLRDPGLFERYRGKLSPELFKDKEVSFVVDRLLKGDPPERMVNDCGQDISSLVAKALFSEASPDEELSVLEERILKRIELFELERIKRRIKELAASNMCDTEEYKSLVSTYIEKLKATKRVGGGIHESC